MYLLQLLDHHVCSGTTLLLLALCQSISIGWVYGEVTTHGGRLSRAPSKDLILLFLPLFLFSFLLNLHHSCSLSLFPSCFFRPSILYSSLFSSSSTTSYFSFSSLHPSPPSSLSSSPFYFTISISSTSTFSFPPPPSSSSNTSSSTTFSTSLSSSIYSCSSVSYTSSSISYPPYPCPIPFSSPPLPSQVLTVSTTTSRT